MFTTYRGAVWWCAVVRLFADTVFDWYRRRMELARASGGRGTAITVVQRVSSDLRCNPHIHAIFIDGVFVPEDEGGKPSFHPPPQLSTGVFGYAQKCCQQCATKLVCK